MGKYKPGQKGLHLVVSESEHATYQKAAAGQGLNVSAWARQQLSIAAGRAMLGVEPAPDNSLRPALDALEQRMDKLEGLLIDAFPYLGLRKDTE